MPQELPESNGRKASNEYGNTLIVRLTISEDMIEMPGEGKSFREYLNMTRINRAQQMLLTTNKSVTEISSACGYNNVSHFIATYRQIKGITPKSAGKKSEKNT